MDKRRLASAVYTTLKALTAQLVDNRFGHQKVAAAATRVDQQAVSEYGNTLRPQRFVPVDVLLDWMDATGDTTLLKFMAETAGCLLVPLPRGAGMSEVGTRTARTAEEFAQVVSGVMTALADGKINRQEGERILTDLHELMLEAAGLAEAVKAKVEADE